MNITEEVLRVANQYLTKVKRSGNVNIMAVCPFHMKADGSSERTPSFAMNTTNGLYLCHSCGERGNLITFFKKFGLSREVIDRHYKPLIDAVAQNIPERPDPLDPKIFSTNPLPESLLGLFDYCPLALLEAGFTEETLKRFEVGFDMTHKRITYPIRDLKGQLVAISGRAVGPNSLRYKIYDKEYKVWDLPERTGWDKRSVLYNAHVVYPACYFMTSIGEVVVVEGFKAAMWVHQCGVANVVALMGTYLSWEHQWILERIGGTVYLFLDNNDAGARGTAIAGSKLSRSLSVKVVNYPTRLAADEEAQPDRLTIEELELAKSSADDYYVWLNRQISEKKVNGIWQES